MSRSARRGHGGTARHRYRTYATVGVRLRIGMVLALRALVPTSTSSIVSCACRVLSRRARVLASFVLFAANLAAQPPVPTNGDAPIRVGIRARNGGADRLTSLRYIGGFETKTMLLETLVRRDRDGRIAPALARRWQILDGGRSFRFELREDARFHDGTPVTADAVATHCRRWLGLPEHDWLPVNVHLRGVEAESPHVLRVDLDRPFALLEDLVSINPCAVVGPAAKDWEGEFVRPIGSGPFRFVAAFDDGSRWRVARVDGDGPAIDVTFHPRGRDATPIDELLAGRLDAFVGGWDEDLPAERLDAIGSDADFVVQTAPGSSVVMLSFRLDEGPTADRELRRHVAHVLDRARLIDEVEGGRAAPCTTWAAPTVAFWPRGRTIPAPQPPPPAGTRLTIAAGRPESRAARAAVAVAGQLRAAGYEIEVLTPPRVRPESPAEIVDATGAVTPLTTESGEVRAAVREAVRANAARADLRVEITHGMPYCPHQSLVARFGSRWDGEVPRAGATPALRALVDRAAREPDEAARLPLYAEIQDLMHHEALLVPLYVPHRVALRRTTIDGIGLGPDVYHVDLTALRRVDR